MSISRNLMGAMTLAILVSSVTSIPVQAQQRGAGSLDLSVGLGWSALWDDETNLGKGVPAAGGVSRTFGEHLRLGADVDWVGHVRDSGYLRAEGDLVGAFGRATYLFGRSGSQVRPVVGAGLGLLRSSGVLIGRSMVPGPGGLPVAGPDARTPWSVTRSAFDLHGGLRLALSDRLALRPEVRWRATFGSGSTAGIEPPLVAIQAMVHLDVSLD